MNLTIARGLVREQFKRTIPMFVLATGITVVMTGLSYWDYVRAEIPDTLPPAIGGAIGGIWLAHFFSIFYLLYCFSDNRDLKLSMPGYLLRLPLRTASLIFWRMGYSVIFLATLGVLSSAWFYALFRGPIGSPETLAELLPFWLPIQISVTVFVCLQALAWIIGGSGAGIAVAASALFVLYANIDRYVHFSMVDSEFYEGPPALISIAVAVVLAWVGVTLRRRGTIDLDNAIAAVGPKRAGRRGGELPPFESPAAALRWLEWRRIGRSLPLLVVLFTVVLAITGYRDSVPPPLGWSEEVERAFQANTFAMLFYSALGFGVLCFSVYALFQNQRLQLGPQKSFFYLRPVSTRALATTRISVALRGLLFASIPFALVVPVTLYFALQTEEFGLKTVFERYDLPQTLGIVALLALAYFSALWSIQWLANGFAIGTAFALTSLIAWGMYEAGLLESNWQRENVALMLAAVLTIPTAGYLFARAWREQLLDTKSFVPWLIAWPIFLAGFLMYGNWVNLNDGNAITFFAEWRIVLLVSTLPILPFATTPLIMHYTRHR